MKNIILAGTSIVIVSLLGASVFASTITTNTSPQLSGLTTGIISVLGTNMIANPAITMLSSSDLYIEEKIRPHIGKSKNMNIIAASGIISLSGQSSMSGTGEIMVNSGSLLNSTINLGNRYANRSEKFEKMTEIEKQKYIESIITAQVRNSTYQGMQIVTVSITASGINNSGSVESLTLLPIKQDKKIPGKRKYEKNRENNNYIKNNSNFLELFLLYVQ